MNSKFVYVEKHIRTQINQLYRNILLQQCNLELRMMQNALAIAQSPDIFAYHFIRGPGYMALLAGEVIHIIKCIAVEVKLARTQECYEQLPVTWNTQTYFLTPQTHILMQQGTQITCNSLAPPMYLLGDAWYKLPRPVETLASTIMKPLTKPTWKYISPGALATSEIYSQEDLEELKDHIMFPAERPIILNIVARGIIGQSTLLYGGSISNLIDEASVEKIAISTWHKFWDKFLIFGNISVGMLGIHLHNRFQISNRHARARVRFVHCVWMVIIPARGHMELGYTTSITLGKRETQGRESLQYVRRRTRRQAYTKNNAEPKRIYLAIPTKEASTYTFELKG